MEHSSQKVNFLLGYLPRPYMDTAFHPIRAESKWRSSIPRISLPPTLKTRTNVDRIGIGSNVPKGLRNFSTELSAEILNVLS